MPTPEAYARTARTTASRARDRVGYDRAAVHAVLDEAYLCHLAFIVEGEPRILPTLHVRVEDTLYLHGSTGSRPMLAARARNADHDRRHDGRHDSTQDGRHDSTHDGRHDGLPVSLAVTLLDGLVYARSQFHHSANYRSVVVHGVAHLVTDDAEKRRVLTALMDKLGPGRAADSRPPSAKELAETAVLALPLREVSIKARAGGVNDDPEDLTLPHWAGVVPLRLAPGAPVAEAGVTAATPHYLPV